MGAAGSVVVEELTAGSVVGAVVVGLVVVGVEAVVDADAVGAEAVVVVVGATVVLLDCGRSIRFAATGSDCCA